MRSITAICIVASLMIGASRAQTFEDRWNDMLTDYNIRHGVPDSVAAQPPVMDPGPTMPPFKLPSRKASTHHRRHGHFVCRHIWHGKHWRC